MARRDEAEDWVRGIVLNALDIEEYEEEEEEEDDDEGEDDEDNY